MGEVPVGVVILTYNEELNLPMALQSVCGWAKQVLVVDSFSTDRTLDVARDYNVEVCQNPWANWASQRNWALDNLPLQTEWVFFIDADEQLTDVLKQEIEEALTRTSADTAAFAVKQAFVFLGRYLKHAQDGPHLVRLVRRTRAKWFCQGAREYCAVDGSTLVLSAQLWHEDHKGLSAWIDKHNQNATREARLFLQNASGQQLNPVEAKRGGERRVRYWVRQRIWNRLPPFGRPLLYFLYRYFLKGGVLDGVEGFIYTFLHAFWYTFLIDAKKYELVRRPRQGNGAQ